jgi:uncharacterized protein (TIGR02466 family)
MLLQLFPQLIYIENDPSFLRQSNEWYDRALPYFLGHELLKDGKPTGRAAFRTTLAQGAGYTPGTCSVTWNPRNDPDWPSWAQLIETHVDCYTRSQQLISYKVIIANTWLNEYRNEGDQLEHQHYGYSLSGVYYPMVSEGSNQIVFHSDKTEFKHYLIPDTITAANAHSWPVKVKTGDIILFPSSLKHSVPRTEFDGVRRSIAFDIVLKPKIK